MLLFTSWALLTPTDPLLVSPLRVLPHLQIIWYIIKYFFFIPTHTCTYLNPCEQCVSYGDTSGCKRQIPKSQWLYRVKVYFFLWNIAKLDILQETPIQLSSMPCLKIQFLPTCISGVFNVHVTSKPPWRSSPLSHSVSKSEWRVVHNKS